MRRTALAIAFALLAACSGAKSPEQCWEDAVNRDVADGGCQGMSDPYAQESCLDHWYNLCQSNADY